MFVWIPCIIHAIFIRGYDSNFLRLMAWNKMQYIVPIAMFVMVGIHLTPQLVFSYLQSKIGPYFFIPNSWLPGHHNYKITVASLKPDQQSEECPICFTPINLNPGEGPVETNSDHQSEGHQSNQAPLIEQEKMKYCYQTPCKHNFHAFCLTKWFEKKPDCPVCRKPLPYLE